MPGFALRVEMKSAAAFRALTLLSALGYASGDCCALPGDTYTCDGKYNCCPGLYPDNRGVCQPCPPGYYCNIAGGMVACPAGTYNDRFRATNATWCLMQGRDCPAGSYVLSPPNSARNVVCAACKTNCSNYEFMQGECPGGQSQVDSVQCVACRDCESGWYHSPRCDGTLHRESECVACTSGGCNRGFYRGACSQSLDGACVPCRTCPDGEYNKGCGGDSPGNCTKCTTCGLGWEQYRNCSALEDTGCKGGPCNTSVSCGALFCNYPAMSTPNCAWKWTGTVVSVNFLCITSPTQGTCQQCPQGWTASGAYCVECARGSSCDRAGGVKCDGACVSGKYPTCDVYTGRSVCSACQVNYTLLAQGHRRLTRGGVLDSPDLCDAYFECDVGYYLTSDVNQTSVSCQGCSFPEKSQVEFEVISRGLTFGDRYSCLYTTTRAPANSSNALGQYGSPAQSCPPGFTSEPGRAQTLDGCVACANAPAHGGFEQARFDCAPRCAEEDGYERRGELCVLSDRRRVPCAGLDGYDLSDGGACSSSALPWSEPGKQNSPDGWLATLTPHAEGPLTGLDGASRYRATAERLYAPDGGDPCSGVQSILPNLGYVQDKPLFTFVCKDREMHTFYMVVKGDKFMYAFLERTFGNNNRYVMWQVQLDGALPGRVGQTWRLPGKVCSAAWTSMDGYDYVHLAFCKAPFLAFVQAPDLRGGQSSAELANVETDGAQIFAMGRRVRVMAGRDAVGRQDGMRDVALFGPSLSVANTSDPRRLLVADRDNCRLVEVVIDYPGSFLTRATTIGSGSCYSGPHPTPFPRLLASVLGGQAAIFVTDLGLMQMDSVTRTVQLAVPEAEFPLANPLWISAAEEGSALYMANSTHQATLRRMQVACPPRHESRRGGGCVPCGESAYVTQQGGCAECSQPACELGRQRLVKCGDASDARCEACAAPSQAPPYPRYTFDANCSVVPAPPCPYGYYNGTAGPDGACFPCPSTWSATAAYDGVSGAGVCQCFAQRGAAEARVDANGTCQLGSPFGAEAGPYFSPGWARGLNCTYEDEGCRFRGCYLQSAFPRKCAECNQGLYGVNGMWCERCPGFRDPSPARDSCLCRAPSAVAEDGSGSCVCPAGHAEGGPAGCTPCLPGTFKPAVAVMRDDYLAQAGACDPCPEGMESDAGASACRPCLAGLYREEGSTFGLCRACAAQNHYAADAHDGSSCVPCQVGCAEGQRWDPCPVNPAMYACRACDNIPSGGLRSWVKGADNRQCLWECKQGYYESGVECVVCTRRECEFGSVFTPCSRYEDGHCRMGCVNETMPKENALWGAGCTWNCAPGFAPREKLYAGWIEYACERETLLPWSGWW